MAPRHRDIAVSALPETIGRYQVTGLLGRGAMGVVLRAHDPAIGRTVAIKLIRADLLEGQDGEEHGERFRREAQAAGRCSHPNIVALHDLSLHEGSPFLVMEHVAGCSLAALLRERPPAQGEAVAIALQLLDALGCAHALGVVHRDVKPANVLLDAAGRVKMTDFGISHLANSELTQAGTMIGTPAFMSPEQCRGEEVGPPSDLFSVATVLHEMLAGTRPFQGDNIHALTRALLCDTPPRIPGLSPGLAAVLTRAHSKNPGHRFTSAREMAVALERAAGGHPEDSSCTVMLSRTVPGDPMAPGPGAVAPALDPAVVGSLEATLARYVGPLASHLVRMAALEVASVGALRDILARGLEEEGQRSAFLRDTGAHAERSTAGSTTCATPSAPDDTGSSRPLPAETLDLVTRELSRHVGPIARVLVRRAAQAGSEQELRIALAHHVPGDADRLRFRQGRS